MPPVFSRLLPVLTSAYTLQTAFALYFVPRANEKYYDLAGALGFLSTTFVSLYYPSLKTKFWDHMPDTILPALSTFAPRQLLATAALSMWCIRLGTFLAMRALKAGGDSRFDEVKHQPGKFAGYWMAQATWVFLVGLPVYLVNTIPPAAHSPLGARDHLSVSIFTASWLLEIVADHQKTVWRRAKDNKEHDEQFISTGLWSLSRHPNYVGEVCLWVGIWALCSTSLTAPYVPRYTWLFTAVSPLMTYFLLRKVSGVPPLEKAGDKRFAGPKWDHYKRTVPIFWPWGGMS
ncbi:uncharacterized protein PHACADRAFT_251589 [Phanerochaete carnosa HHB-10118-sp]|uniref:Steroid 5-alpha reductase C-terminal domain-containing protein n=1 Tax=Phanerochaete carnosa (strain HHB-10118-sp) TaxID=650164 RepID=K5X4J4_PHACS|nr:uncharacterized protein PHACADRAFT_251589 [Phanerochaete carnosa HHB-10118-sp]EKM57757.1 hypothetical protein PHACADRAFT_251589 [Phanerochaete carnosa HHB-10118-sp]